MTVKSSGSLAFSEIQTEFTGSNPISLSEYYAGGATGYVPAGTTGINGAIPSSVAISVSKFYGSIKFTPVTNTFTSGSGNVSIPYGAQSVTITVVGAGGYGGNSYTDTGSDYYSSGGGGGGAGYSRKTIAVAYGDWPGTIAYSVGSYGGQSSTSSGTLAAGAISITATGGDAGTSGDQYSAGSGGSGGSGSGGDINLNGSSGGSGGNGNSSGVGGGGGGGNGSIYGDVNSYGNGAAGASSPGTADQPSYGVIIFAWT